MKRKVVAAILVAAMGTTMLAGCGGSSCRQRNQRIFRRNYQRERNQRRFFRRLHQRRQRRGSGRRPACLRYLQIRRPGMVHQRGRSGTGKS